MQEGENATFTCSLADIPDSFVLNWYRLSPRNQTDKLAAFQEDRIEPGRDRRFRVTRLPNGRDFHMSIVAARLNDSGIYLCGAIYLPPNTQINESPRAELSVTGAAPLQLCPPPARGGWCPTVVVGGTQPPGPARKVQPAGGCQGQAPLRIRLSRGAAWARLLSAGQTRHLRTWGAVSPRDPSPCPPIS